MNHHVVNLAFYVLSFANHSKAPFKGQKLCTSLYHTLPTPAQHPAQHPAYSKNLMHEPQVNYLYIYMIYIYTYNFYVFKYFTSTKIISSCNPVIYHQ